MRKEFLKKARDTLLDMKKQLRREIQDGVRGESEGGKDVGRDTCDLASDERDREINMILSDRDREKLMAIDDAMQHIEAKTYGMCDCGCERCDGEIGLARLKVLPFTRLCVRCQEETEKENRLLNRAEDERTFRRLTSTEAEDESF